LGFSKKLFLSRRGREGVMNFLNIGPWELSVILVIAILMIGPKRMVQIVRAIGRITGQMRRLSGEFLGTIQAELRTIEQETSQAVGGSGEERATISLPDDLMALGRDTRQAVSEIAANTDSILKGEQEASEEGHNG